MNNPLPALQPLFAFIMTARLLEKPADQRIPQLKEWLEMEMITQEQYDRMLAALVKNDTAP